MHISTHTKRPYPLFVEKFFSELSFFTPFLRSKEILSIIILTVTLLFFTIAHGTATENSLRFLLEILITLGTLPLVFSIIEHLLHREYGVDSIALAAITATLYFNETAAGAIVLIMVNSGILLENYARNRAREGLLLLAEGAPSIANRKKGTHFETISVTEVLQHDILLVKPGEVVPVDGVVLTGESTIDESMITGEPLPKDASEGVRIFSGSINGGGILTLRALSTYEGSSYANILTLVKAAEDNKAPLVRLADTLSLPFTLITGVLGGIAYLIDPSLLVAVLVVATPCPLLLAPPTAFLAGISRASKKGLLVRHGGVFEVAHSASVFLFDKTGTLTEGFPRVEQVVPHKPHIMREDVVEIASSLAQYSLHILSQSITDYAQEKQYKQSEIIDHREYLGKGMTGIFNNERVALGTLSFLESLSVPTTATIKKLDQEIKARGGVSTHIAKEGILVGTIIFSDTLRTTAPETILALKKMRPHAEFVLLSGDTKERVAEVSKDLPFEKRVSEAKPEDKTNEILSYAARGKATVMIGDGINDAPALAAASLGIALGGRGRTASTETADVIVLNDTLSSLTDLLLISDRTIAITKQSMTIGISLSVLLMLVALTGVLPATLGALLQEGVDVLVILNALRALK